MKIQIKGNFDDYIGNTEDEIGSCQIADILLERLKADLEIEFRKMFMDWKFNRFTQEAITNQSKEENGG